MAIRAHRYWSTGKNTDTNYNMLISYLIRRFGALSTHANARYVDLIKSRSAETDPLGISATRRAVDAKIATLRLATPVTRGHPLLLAASLVVGHSRTIFRARNSRSDGNTREKYTERYAHDPEDRCGAQVTGAQFEKYRKRNCDSRKYRNARDDLFG